MDYPDLQCPEALPVREEQLSNARQGDRAITSYDFRWPLRVPLPAGSNRLMYALIKSSLCLKIPVCDMKFQSIPQRYGPDGNANDCSGAGQSQWNKKKGNHCRCSKGYTSFTGFLNNSTKELEPTCTSKLAHDCVFRQ